MTRIVGSANIVVGRRERRGHPARDSLCYIASYVGKANGHRVTSSRMLGPPCDHFHSKTAPLYGANFIVQLTPLREIVSNP